jgi:hypothetical protein
MNPLIKKLCVALVLAVVLVLPLLQASNAYSAEFSAPEKVLIFLTDVVGLDMTKYDATLMNNRVEYPSALGGLAKESGRYTLESDGSKIDVTYKFRNKTLYYCKINILEGSPFYTQPSPSVLDSAKGVLQRYQNYVTASYLQVMGNMLETVTELKTITKTSDNMKFKVSTNGDSTDFSWIYTSNGLDFTRKGTYIYFEHGHLTYFMDGWYLYKIGSDSINVSEEEAISIARNATKYVPKLYGNVDNETIVLQPKVAEKPVESELIVGIKETLTLHPLWHIQLYFDKPYGNYYGVAVDIWADTGEISGTPYGKGVMGSFHDGEKSEEAQTEPFTDSLLDGPIDQPSLDLTPMLIAVPIALTVILGATFYRRKQRITTTKHK